MGTFGDTEIHTLLAEIRRLKSSPQPLTDADWRVLFSKMESAILQLLANLNDLHDGVMIVSTRVDDLKRDKPLKDIDNSYQKMILNKIEILRNLVNKNNEVGKDENYFSMDLIKIEGIEKDIVEKHSVTQDQMKALNEIYKRHVSKIDV